MSAGRFLFVPNFGVPQSPMIWNGEEKSFTVDLISNSNNNYSLVSQSKANR